MPPKNEQPPEQQERKPYVPPVGPGSKSAPPVPRWDEIPQGIIPPIERVKE